jgi:hypothetical protein
MAVKVVNMIPNSLSNDNGRDSEPNITTSFLDPAHIAASAFTLDPLSSGNAPIYLSTDGGDTWVLSVVLPGGNKTGDTTLRYVGPSNVLYAGILRTDNANLNILRKPDVTVPGLMDVLVTKTNDDQPYVEGATAMAGAGTGQDRVYVGENDFAAASGHTATIDLSLDAATAPAPAGFATHSIETRATSPQDGPPIRPAVHLDGTVYGVYQAWRSASTMDVVVVRDDNWGSGGTPFTALVEPPGPPPLDGKAGVRVVIGASRTPLGSLLGTQRVGGQLAIAVDPRDSDTVYIAWADGASSASQTIRVRRSLNRGVTWSGDLIAISTATNPGLAINQQGVVGLLYQQLHNPGSGNRWQTHFRSSGNGFTTGTDAILADVPDSNGTYAGPNPIGDYAGLIAVGKNFYGIFSGNNTPDMANFPNSVTYQRNANFTTHTLLDLASSPVGVSIDPFFFKVTTVEARDDFYVRDWTDSPASGDNGAEPSTHPAFYVSSDVWNRRGTLPGTFPNDQPENEDAGNGAGNLGDNWAFARIRRNAPAASGTQAVTAHFLVSKFGTGSNYVDSSSGDPDVTFLDPDPNVNFNAADLGPLLTSPVHWHLNAIASTHLCLAVEITGPNDPFVPPSLLGNTPGWPTTDLRIVNDNNKAQRNMGLSTTPARGVGLSDCFYGIVHNAAPFPRDFELRYEAAREVASAFKSSVIEVIGGEDTPFRGSGSIRLTKMQPGENRWVGLRFPAAVGKEGQILAVNFLEVVEGVVVNGFGMGAKLAAIGDVIRERLQRHRSVFTRIATSGVNAAKESADAAGKLAGKRGLAEADYIHFMQTSVESVQRVLSELIAPSHGADTFRIGAALQGLSAAVSTGKADSMAIPHGCILNKVDSLLTMRQLVNGNVADILQNVRWQKYLYTTGVRLIKVDCAADVRKRSHEFIQAYGVRKASNRDYSALVRVLLPCFQKTAGTLGDQALQALVPRLEQSLGDLVKLQKAHRDYLLRLQDLRG